MRQSLRLFLLAIGLVVLVVLCRTLGPGELERAVAGASPEKFALFLALSTGVFLVYATRWSVVLRAMNAPQLPIATLLCFRATEHAVSSLLPSAHLSGEPLRAYLLRRRGIDWTLAISSVTMDRVLDLSASSIVGPVYVGIFFFANNRSSWAAPWAMAVMLACGAALAAFYYFAYRGGILLSIFARLPIFAPIRGSLGSIDSNLAGFIRSPSFRLGLALSFLAEALVLAELWTLSRAFHLSISLPTLVGVMVGMGISQLLPVPAALGSLEATEVGVLTLAGAGAPLGLAVGVLVRLRETLWIFVGLVGLYLEGLSWRTAESAVTSNASVSARSLNP